MITLIDLSFPQRPGAAGAVSGPPVTVSPRPWLSHRVIAGGPGRWHDVGPAAMGGDMRKLIVSSLVSLDGSYGDPQSWAGDYAPAR